MQAVSLCGRQYVSAILPCRVGRRTCPSPQRCQQGVQLSRRDSSCAAVRCVCLPWRFLLGATQWLAHMRRAFVVGVTSLVVFQRQLVLRPSGHLHCAPGHRLKDARFGRLGPTYLPRVLVGATARGSRDAAAPGPAEPPCSSKFSMASSKGAVALAFRLTASITSPSSLYPASAQ